MEEHEGSGRLRLLHEVIAQTCALVAPRQCPCGREGAWLCHACAALLRAEPRRVDSCCDALQELAAARVREERRGEHLLPAGVDHAPLLPVLALGEYGGDLQRLILAWKNGGMLHLQGARISPGAHPRGGAPGGVGRWGPQCMIVPVPSQRSARAAPRGGPRRRTGARDGTQRRGTRPAAGRDPRRPGRPGCAPAGPDRSCSQGPAPAEQDERRRP